MPPPVLCRGGPNEVGGAGNDPELLRIRRTKRPWPGTSWLGKQSVRVLPKSPMSQAIGYARSNWAALNRCLEAGSLQIDNNTSERAVKAVAMAAGIGYSQSVKERGGPP